MLPLRPRHRPDPLMVPDRVAAGLHAGRGYERAFGSPGLKLFRRTLPAPPAGPRLRPVTGSRSGEKLRASVADGVPRNTTLPSASTTVQDAATQRSTSLTPSAGGGGGAVRAGLF